MIKLDPDIIKTNILIKFEEDWVKTVAPRVPTRFFKDLTYFFYPNPLTFDLNPDIIKTNFLGKLKKIWVTTVAARVLTRFC